jgi:hypothetical protein
MRCTWFALLSGAALLFAAVPLSANPAPVSLFNECAHAAKSWGCSYVLDFGSNGKDNLYFDQSAKGVDDQGDVIVGIHNDSGSYKSLWGYTGPNNMLSGLNLKGGLEDGESTYIVMKDSFAYFDKEDDKEDDDPYKICVTPEPGSLALFGTGLVFLGGVLRRKLLL